MCKQESSSDESPKIYIRNELFMMETQLLNLLSVYIYPPYRGWPFTYHMCAYLVQITAVKCDAQP